MTGGGQITEERGEIGVKEERKSEGKNGRGMRGRNGKEEPCVVHLRSV